jgi:hypothetical protein
MKKLFGGLAMVLLIGYAFEFQPPELLSYQGDFDLPDLNGQALTPCKCGEVCDCTNCDCYNAAYKQAIAQGKPFVLGVGVKPPVGNWLSAQVAASLVHYNPGQVIVAKPAKGALLVQAKITGATAESVQTVLNQATTDLPTTTTTAAPTITYYNATPTYGGVYGGYGAGGCAGVTYAAGGCAGVSYGAPVYASYGAGGCAGVSACANGSCGAGGCGLLRGLFGCR